MASAGRTAKKNKTVAGGKKQQQEKAPRAPVTGKQQQEEAPQAAVTGRQQIDFAAIIEQLLAAITGQIKEKKLKPSLGDFIRLLQMQKELDKDEPREIEVRWVETREPEPVND